MAFTRSVNVAAQVAGFVIQHSGAIVDGEKFTAFQATLEALE
jgi:hypothetical protein